MITGIKSYIDTELNGGVNTWSFRKIIHKLPPKGYGLKAFALFSMKSCTYIGLELHINPQ